MGTTWQKQEGRFLIGSSSSYAIGSTGGSATTTLSKANLPAIKLKTEAHIHTQPAHNHGANRFNYTSRNTQGGSYSVADILVGGPLNAGGESTGSASPYTEQLGSGTAFNNMPPYLAVNIWKRLT